VISTGFRIPSWFELAVSSARKATPPFSSTPVMAGVAAESLDADGGAGGRDLVEDPFHRRAQTQFLPRVEVRSHADVEIRRSWRQPTGLQGGERRRS
jgi:hypothetical protein